MKNWVTKKLGEVCELSAGGDVPNDNFSEIKTDKHQIPIFANGEKNEGFYGFTSKAKVTKPSITVSARGTIGFAVKRLEPFFPIVRLIVVTPINLKELGLDYLDYALRKIDFKHSGSSIPQLTVPMIRDYEIPLPPLPEQQRIVTILDAAFAAIAKAKANAEQNLKNAKELFESYLQGVFENKGEGWEEKKLIEVCELIMGQSPAGETYNTDGDGVPLINGPVEFGKQPFSKTIKSKFTTDPTKYCKEGDLILCVRGSTTGRINIAGFDACIGRGVAAIRYSKNQFWLNYFILSSRQKIYKLGTGATFPNVSGEILKKILIPIPPIKTQLTIVKKLDALSSETKKLEAIYQTKLNDLEELKKSVLQKAFSGQLSESGFSGLKDKKDLSGSKRNRVNSKVM